MTPTRKQIDRVGEAITAETGVRPSTSSVENIIAAAFASRTAMTKSEARLHGVMISAQDRIHRALTIRELAAEAGFRGHGHVQYLLTRLEEKGYATRVGLHYYALRQGWEDSDG